MKEVVVQRDELPSTLPIFEAITEDSFRDHREALKGRLLSETFKYRDCIFLGMWRMSGQCFYLETNAAPVLLETEDGKLESLKSLHSPI